jgi:muramoyltetrapeptide carboxypeptidase
MICPPYLKKGDAVGIISTARKISLDEITPAVEAFKKWSLEVVVGNTIGAAENQFAGSDALRTADLQRMFDDPAIKAIVCGRGGYGTLRIIDNIDFKQFKKSPKWLVGYSDITVIHTYLQKLGFQSLHAVMPVNFPPVGMENSATIMLHKALFGERLSYVTELPSAHNRAGKAEARLVGGNLSMLYALQGSINDLDCDGKILFIEDLDEYLYHIDRMMLSLKRSGKLDKLAGLVVGGMEAMRDNATPFGKTAEEIIFDAVKEYHYPVLFNFPAGHISDNRALIMGAEVLLSVSAEAGIVNFKQ